MITIMNDNGGHLINFFRLYNLVKGGTLLQNKKVYTLTWVAPGSREKKSD